MAVNICLACGILQEVDRHPIRTRGSGGKDDAFNVIYLCRTHHTEFHDHPPLDFINKYPTVKHFMVRNGWKFSRARNKWFHPAYR